MPTEVDLIFSYAGLLSLACVCIYIGAFGSLPRDRGAEHKTESEDEDEDEQPERLSLEDAWLFPIIGSVVLFGLFVVIKYFGKEWINWLLGWYFSVAGIGSVWKSLVSLTRYLLGNEQWRRFERFSVHLKRGGVDIFSLKWRTPSLILLPLSVIPSVLYRYSSASRRSALLTDVLSMSFCHNALSLLKLDSFKTGTALLSGLFLYDIWWVFGTPVMVEVATKLDVPIKLLWPKSLYFSDESGFTLLGLGDVVIPGCFVALALRFDYHEHLKKGKGKGFSKPYFYASLSAYVLGLVTTMSVMHIFKAAQPALLYLSPACILSFVTTALVRGELSEAWSWIDETDETKSEEKSKKQN
ncbi:peptidase A22B, signal peptide peptidase [Lentinula aciculospora]|uniref:Peptidase A22B, signal peptide peptidase n=1 Tax=Lentinula aciculospora TaxID=153920 RepID=A0A9W9AIB8_9AGAR|nr:peptidase A22B, signal peptide peptidase [Lentinula aciculospora]